MEIEIVEDSYEGVEEIPCVDLNKIPEDEEVQSKKHEDPNARIWMKMLTLISTSSQLKMMKMTTMRIWK
ncbi:membrane protein [Sesbania bispinosa]|nr:membrane protein [Sesbania bispinosa]